MAPTAPTGQVCGHAYVGRADKEYCPDKCRFAANNLKQRKSTKAGLIAEVNSVRRKTAAY
jgi:hypothetical protein